MTIKEEVEGLLKTKEPIPDDLYLAGEEYARNKLAFQERLFGKKPDDYLVLLIADSIKQLAFSRVTVLACSLQKQYNVIISPDTRVNQGIDPMNDLEKECSTYGTC